MFIIIHCYVHMSIYVGISLISPPCLKCLLCYYSRYILKHVYLLYLFELKLLYTQSQIEQEVRNILAISLNIFKRYFNFVAAYVIN